MREITAQFFAIWKGLRGVQKIIIFSTLVFVIAILGYLLWNSSSSRFVPLSSRESLQNSESEELKEILGKRGIPFEQSQESGILIPKKFQKTLRAELAQKGFSKSQTKGFELFDANMWSKGEKELQVLELRALKGQLERDIAAFENIKGANVILDIAPPRIFGGNPYKTKASIILSLKPKAHLGYSQIQAITYHLAGAVRGLDPHMIAISDTTGKLYHAIDHQGKKENLRITETLMEEQLVSKIEDVLAKVLGLESTYVAATIRLKQEEAVEKIALSLLIDSAKDMKEIERLLNTVLSTYEGEKTYTIEEFPFKKKNLVQETPKVSYRFLNIGSGSLLLVLLVAGVVFGAKRMRKKEEPPGIMEERDLLGEDPEMIALWLSCIDRSRAAKVLATFSQPVQEKVKEAMKHELN